MSAAGMPAVNRAGLRVVKRADALLSLADVKARTNLSGATIYRLRRAGKFPMPIKVGARRVAWIAADIDAWLAERPRVDISTPSLMSG